MAGKKEKSEVKKAAPSRLQGDPREEALRAYAALQIQNFPKALKFARLAVGKQGNYPLALQLQALAEFRLGLVREAETTVQKAIQLEPENPEPLFLLALIQAEGGQILPAEKQFRAVLEMAPDNPVFSLDYAAFLLHRRRFPEVVRLAQKVLEKDPQNPKAKLLLDCGKNQAWRKEADDLSFAPPMPFPADQIETWLKLGRIYILLNVQDFAVTAYQQALKIDSFNVRAKREFATALRLKASSSVRWLRFYSQLVTIPWVAGLILLLLLGILAYSFFLKDNLAILNFAGGYFLAFQIIPWLGLRWCNVDCFERFRKIYRLTETGELRDYVEQNLKVNQLEILRDQWQFKKNMYQLWSKFFVWFGFGLVILFVVLMNMVPMAQGKAGEPTIQALQLIFPPSFLSSLSLGLAFYWKAGGYEE